MSKHNKKRNTAFLYEVLVREVVKRTLNKDAKERNKVITTLKKSFKNTAEIGKELRLFKTLLETNGVSNRVGEKLIQETKKAYSKLDKKKIFQEQSALIKKINKEISKGVFSNFVPNYRDLATLSQIFGEDVNVKKRVMLEESILRKITFNEALAAKSDKITNLVVNKFIEKFNKKYDQKLFENQKILLNKFILSFVDNGIDFKVFLNEEIENLKNTINKSFKLEELKNDEKMSARMREVQSFLEDHNKEPINETSLQRLLKIQALAVETQI